MKCDFSYCVYHQDDSCRLSKIQINAVGMCDACIVISVSDAELKLSKEKQLSDIENRKKG